ncbi:unnamed protein product [Linum trigynum]|uniref:Uncharacterized protein n=1 Tax=Linum trigynum TaxID=586398 RepID=A0AAV2EQ06_9ROSI
MEPAASAAAPVARVTTASIAAPVDEKAKREEAADCWVSFPIVTVVEIQSSTSLGSSLAGLTTDIERKREDEAVIVFCVHSTTLEVVPAAQVPATTTRRMRQVASTAADSL